jgi:hypothetical protein
MRNKIVMILALFAVMAAMTEIGSAIVEEDPVLWVVPDNPTRYSGLSSDSILSETVVEDVTMGTSFSGNVLVLNQESYGNPKADATGVKIYFVVKNEDISNVLNIDIGTAKRISTIPNPDVITDPNPDSNSATGTSLTFSPNDPNPGGPDGYWVSYLIGTIPHSGGASLTGDPQINLATFNPYNGKYLLKVPFTIHFKNQPSPGFVLGVYADNGLAGNLWAHTAYSHDGGYSNQIPEFPTVALPIAAVIGLVFFFQNRKKKEE